MMATRHVAELGALFLIGVTTWALFYIGEPGWGLLFPVLALLVLVGVSVVLELALLARYGTGLARDPEEESESDL
jgi:glucose dehydrogenase